MKRPKHMVVFYRDTCLWCDRASGRRAYCLHHYHPMKAAVPQQMLMKGSEEM